MHPLRAVFYTTPANPSLVLQILNCYFAVLAAPASVALLLWVSPLPAAAPLRAAVLPAGFCLLDAADELKMLPPPLLPAPRSLPVLLVLPLLLPGTRRDSCFFSDDGSLLGGALLSSLMPAGLPALGSAALVPGMREATDPAAGLLLAVLLAPDPAAACKRLLMAAMSGALGLLPVTSLPGVDAPEAAADRAADFGDGSAALPLGILLVLDPLPTCTGAGPERPNERPNADRMLPLGVNLGDASGFETAGLGGVLPLLGLRVSVATRGSGVGRLVTSGRAGSDMAEQTLLLLTALARLQLALRSRFATTS